MGLIAGDMNAVGKDLKNSAIVTAYKTGPSWYAFSSASDVIDTIPIGTDLGVCTDTSDNTFFGAGYFWIHCPAPATPIGTNSAITTDFWIVYNAAITDADGNSVGPTNAGIDFSTVDNYIWFILVAVAILAGIFLYFKYGKK